MSQGVSFSGLGSGLDTDSIISQLVDIERRPVVLIQRRQARLEQQKGVIQSINSKLLSLKSSVEKLEDEDAFAIVNARSSDAAKVGVSASNEAAGGTFSVEVLKLAQAESISSGSFSNINEALNLSGDIVVNGQAVEISEDDTLLDVSFSINDANAGVSAQILTVASGDNRLILTAEAVGEAGFDLRDASTTNVLQSLGFTSSDVAVKNAFVNGARSDKFLAEDESLGSLLNLGSPPSSTVTIGDREVDIDLNTDTLADLRDKINAVAPTGAVADVVSSVEGGLTRFQLEISGTTTFADSSGILTSIGILDVDGNTADGITSGAETDLFRSTTTSIGSLLGLSDVESGTVVVGGKNIDIDLAEDSLSDIQSKIDAAGISGVTTSIISSIDEDDNSLFALRIDGTSDFVDDNNVLEAAGIVVGSNRAFESVARVVTSNASNQAKGAIKNSIPDGVKSDILMSNEDTIETLTGSTATGTVTIGDKTVAIDFTADTLADIRDSINAAAPTGVTATINVLGPTEFELQIDGTTDFSDDGGILQALGVIEAPTIATADTRFADIPDAGIQEADTISISGVNHDGDQVSGTFTVSNTNLKISNLLNAIEQTFGNAVTATVDSSGRIVLADDEAGSSSLGLTLTANNESGGSLDLGQLSVTTQGIDARSSVLQAGQDASFSINGITLSRSTNTITDAVQAVTLDLKEAEIGSTVDVTVTKDDTTELRANINQFVADFNSAMELIDEQFHVDEATQQGGPLVGDSTLIALQSRLRSMVSTQIPGLEEGFDALVLIGINFDRNGRLNIDDARLTAALNENLEDVRKLFVAQGSTTDDKIEFISSTRKTNQGSYEVSVTQAATSASFVSDVEFTSTLTEDQTLTLIEKATASPAIIELKAGESLDQVISKINTSLRSDVAEVRRASISNTTNGTATVTANTVFADIFGANVADGDTIRINGTNHNGNSVTDTFTIDDASTVTLADLLRTVRNAFNGNISTSVDSEGRIVITDNQVGPSRLTVTLIEENESGGTLNLGSIDVEEEGRFALDIIASNSGGRLAIDHNAAGERNGFSIAEAIAELGLKVTDISGTDVQATINGEEAQGFGRILTGKVDEENVEGLALRVDLTADEFAASGGELGDVRLVYGVGRLLSDGLSFITDEFEGSLKSRQNAIDDTIDDLDDQIASMNRRIEQVRLGLVNKFAALEGSLATLQSQGDFLSSQLATLNRR